MRQADIDDLGEDSPYVVWHGRGHVVTIWAESPAAAAQQYVTRKNVNNQTKIHIVPLDAVVRYEAQVGVFVKPICS